MNNKENLFSTLHLSVFAIGLSFLFSSIVVEADSLATSVNKYAKACFAAIGIQPSDISDTFDCKANAADRLDVTLNGKSQANATCDQSANRGSCDVEDIKDCDYKTWLNGTCYGNSHLQTFKAKNNNDVTVALLCRHKRLNTDEPKKFDDIAMIMHNQKNGETCWFQALGLGLDGTQVPSPLRPVAEKFWLSPKETAKLGCIKCHDSGPFITSPWLNQAKTARLLRDRKKVYPDPDDPEKRISKYLNSTPPFDQWSKPVFITIGREGLKKANDKPCTYCHNIGTGTFDGELGKTCDSWIDMSISAETKNGRVFMPPKMSNPLAGKFHESDWVDRMMDHVNALKSCCKKFSNNPGYSGNSVCKREY